MTMSSLQGIINRTRRLIQEIEGQSEKGVLVIKRKDGPKTVIFLNRRGKVRRKGKIPKKQQKWSRIVVKVGSERTDFDIPRLDCLPDADQLLEIVEACRRGPALSWPPENQKKEKR